MDSFEERLESSFQRRWEYIWYLSARYRHIHRDHPELVGKALDQAVLDTLTDEEREQMLPWDYKEAREDAILCIIEDATGATGTLRTDRDKDGDPLTGKRRWRRSYGRHESRYQPLDDDSSDVEWTINYYNAIGNAHEEPFELPKRPRARGLLTLTYKGCIAYGTLLRKGFILRKGSQIVPFYDVPEGTIHFQDRVAYGHLVGPGSIVRENLIFPSSGMAGNFVAGRQMSSITKWKLNDGRSLKDLLP